jgi:hypothetical protein
MSLTHVDPHVSEIVMVWIQSDDLLMVWIQISHNLMAFTDMYILHYLFLAQWNISRKRVLTISPDIFNTPAATRYLPTVLKLLLGSFAIKYQLLSRSVVSTAVGCFPCIFN